MAALRLTITLEVDPFGGAQPRSGSTPAFAEAASRRQAEPLEFARGLEFVERQTQTLVRQAIRHSSWP